MRTRTEISSHLTDPGIIAVVRTQRADQVAPACRALLAGGIRALEITLTVPGALELIAQVRNDLGPDAVLGAGTVLTSVQARSAIAAGAEFIVSPIIRRDVLEAAHEAGRPVMLGAYTPTEAQTVHEMGADFVKLFPADGLGAAYVRALRAPLPHLRIVPTGGVDLTTAPAFWKAGCVALGVGSSLLTRTILDGSQWEELTRLARSFVETARDRT
jgi:2-dehydro-3-deoxyphosphogluconate aldolase/(4S)-4-hydroxy-2-oxoglutarate aldolase